MTKDKWHREDKRWYHIPSVRDLYYELGGRGMTFAWAALAGGTWLASLSKLDMTYVTLVSLLLTVVMGKRSYEKWLQHKGNNGGSDGNVDN